jgi:hypothetical protein
VLYVFANADCVCVCLRACIALIQVDSVERIHTSAVVSYAVILRKKCKGVFEKIQSEIALITYKFKMTDVSIRR